MQACNPDTCPPPFLDRNGVRLNHILLYISTGLRQFDIRRVWVFESNPATCHRSLLMKVAVQMQCLWKLFNFAGSTT
jgi:hypothetical protein